MKLVAWVLCLMFSIIAGLVLLAGLMTATSAPQQGAVAAIAVAIAVIPYCFAKAVSEL